MLKLKLVTSIQFECLLSLHSPIFIEGLKNEVEIEIAIQYNDTFKETILSFANMAYTQRLNSQCSQGWFFLFESA